MDKQIFSDFLGQHDLMVISTINSKNKPESALVGYIHDDSLNIVFATRKDSRKAANLELNTDVAIVVGGDKGVTLQIEGVVEKLVADKVDYFADKYIEKTPRAQLFKDNPEMQFYIVAPTWMRLTDVKQSPWKIDELTIN